jgi:uncharacterized membrane protein
MKRYFPLFLYITLVCVSSFLFLGKKSFSIDETYSYYIAHSLPNLISTAWHDEINMWLYYALLHIWMSFGHSDIYIRSLSAIFAVLTVPVFYKLGEYVFNKRTAGIATILLSLHYFFVYYAQDARSYTLLLFLLCLSTYSFVRVKDNRLYKIVYIISSSLITVYALWPPPLPNAR